MYERGRTVLTGSPAPLGILTGDAGYGASDFITELLARDIDARVTLLASETKEEMPTWQQPPRGRSSPSGTRSSYTRACNAG